MRNRLNFVTLLASCALAISVAACAGSSAPGTDGNPVRGDGFTNGAPSAQELQQLLNAEFERLGVDPARAVAQAPLGPQNIVFDLRGTVVDPDGTLGPLPPTGIALDWTELANGDYDENGIVAVNDLTPIGQFFGLNVAYDDPSLHGGFTAWPTGDPTDDGGAADDQPPADGSPAQNWRRARVDGNSDGLISVQDLTNIAIHFGERIAGYRVYRKGPDDGDFVLVPNPLDGGSPLTVNRVAANDLDGRRPVRYSFTDDITSLALGDGDQVQYFIAPYDTTGSSEGQASITLTMSVGVSTNNPPAAAIVANPNPVDVNTDVTFDASGSTDDFGVVQYEWDLDGNGSFETDTAGVATVTTQYAIAGPISVTVRATDGGGLTDTAFTTLQVVAPQGHIISGFVLTDASAPLGGAQMTLNPGGQTTQTVADGSYSFNGILDGDYTVTAVLNGYTMAPNPANVTLAGADQTGVNFAATEAVGGTNSVEGHIYQLTADWPDPFTEPEREPASGIRVQLFDFSTSAFVAEATTDANGLYQFINLPDLLSGAEWKILAADVRGDVVVPVAPHVHFEPDLGNPPNESVTFKDFTMSNGFAYPGQQ